MKNKRGVGCNPHSFFVTPHNPDMSNPNQDISKTKITEDDRIVVAGRTRDAVIAIQKSILYLTRYWFLIANLLAVIILGLGFLAPALMSEGLTGAGQAVYRFLAPHNHQLPQRSYFLFSQAGGIQTYSLEQILAWGADPNDLEAFVGNFEIGFKTALNHRMIAIFVAILLGGMGWGLAGERPRLNRYWLIALSLPMLTDAISNMISENSGAGFSETNAWAVWLTGNVFSNAFYNGTTIGTLNWLLRNVTGVLFGLGLIWFLYTYLSSRFKPVRAKLEPKLRKAKAIK